MPQGINQQLLFLLIFLGLSAASWIFGHLKEQAKIRRAKEEQRRRFEEQLRTGRPPEEKLPVLVPSADPGRDLAEKRQAKLQELRRQQAQAQANRGAKVVVLRPPGATGPTGTPRAPGGQGAPRFPGPGGIPGTVGGPAPLPGSAKNGAGSAPARTRSTPTPGSPGSPGSPGTSRPSQGSPKPKQPVRLSTPQRGVPLDSAELQRYWQQQREQEQVDQERASRMAEQNARAKDEKIRQRDSDRSASNAAAALAAAGPKPYDRPNRPDIRAALMTRSGRPDPSVLAQAVIMAELFTKPIGARDESEMPWNRG